MKVIVFLKRQRKAVRIILSMVLIISMVAYYFSLPEQLFQDPTSTVIEDRHGRLLGARIASDGQWRFPPSDSIPYKFKQSILLFEDQYFYRHPGFNPISLTRAIKQNISAGKIKSGGSTLTMQTIRLFRRNKPRTLMEKVKEILLSTRLEFKESKESILKLYAANAPFGGNIVGLETASWRYFGRNPHLLTWAESATLAVLPNQPSLIYPGKNQLQLKLKRDRLLKKLLANQVIDSMSYQLALDEPLPGKPLPLPSFTNHLIEKVIKDGSMGKKIKTTVDYHLQQSINNIISQHGNQLAGNEIHNASAIVVSVANGSIVSYIGNVGSKNEHGFQVDVINAPRSTGSILKPLLYAAMLDEGAMLSSQLLPDVPTVIGGFSPKNFSKTYDGAVTAETALARSLNIPAVKMLQQYGVEKFHKVLKRQGISTLNKPSNHYGLSLILGGSEATLWDLCTVYANMARSLNEYFIYPKSNNPAIIGPRPISYSDNSIKTAPSQFTPNVYDAGSIWLTFKAMLEVARPTENVSWKYYDSSKKISWKTGTSFGFRDAWAIGVTPQYVVGVWAGNADGEGRPGLTGINAAAPILFDIFDQLPESEWFSKPSSDLISIEVCQSSGFRKGKYCTNTRFIDSHKNGLNTNQCPYHQLVNLDTNHEYQVNSECANINDISPTPWFVLPPIQAYYYRSKSHSYKSLPPFRNDCRIEGSNNHMELIYPKNNSKIYIPRELDGSSSYTVFEAAHANRDATIHWHLNDTYYTTTNMTHQVEIQATAGDYALTLIDQAGNILEHSFEIVSSP